MIRFAKYRIPVYSTALLCAAIAALTYFLIKSGPVDEELNSSASKTPNTTGETYNVKRLNGFQFISPLMFVEPSNKSAHWEPLVQKVASYFEGKKQSGDIISGAVYFKDMESMEWTGYNEQEKFNPGSLMKVPELISILRLEEEKPGTLDKRLFYAAPFVTEKRTRFISKQLEPGKSYSIRELLRYMIAYSDNNATILLDQNLDQRIFNKALTDLGLPEPEKGAINYPVNAGDYSFFMRAIYNASYLTISHSEYAAELLSSSDFKEGFAKGFPPAVKMIHKFGEAGNMEEKQLHESGIVYVNNKPYVLTVMTKGKDILKLSAALGDIAAIVYQQISVH